jgi:LytS/YehU family sensor histidine kinase
MKKKYVAFGSWVIVLTLSSEIISLYFSGFTWQMPKDQMVLMIWFAGLAFVNVGPPIFCGLFVSIKMLKTWYIKEEEKLVLIRENANAELQLLKAQMHPHFLFNTLNNIYSFALDKSPKAPELVLKLSAVIKYMISDCEAALVSVEKEIKMIKDYIGLEKVRYGNHLALQVHIKNDHSNKFIAPFLLIPFIENSFKHGASQILSRPWIKLTLEVNSDHLYFELSNSRPNEIPELNAKKGIGLRNVEKRLQLLYPESHELAIMNEGTQFTVVMRVPLKEVRQHATVHEALFLQEAYQH